MQTSLLELLVIFIICAIAVAVFKNATLGQLDHVHPPAAVLQQMADKEVTTRPYQCNNNTSLLQYKIFPLRKF
jgi:hypothetical protein